MYLGISLRGDGSAPTNSNTSIHRSHHVTTPSSEILHWRLFKYLSMLKLSSIRIMIQWIQNGKPKWRQRTKKIFNNWINQLLKMTGRSTSTISDVIRSFEQAIFICVKMKQLKIFLKILKNIHIVMNIPIHVGKFSPGVSVDIKEFYGGHISKNVVCSPGYHYTWPPVHINLKFIGWEFDLSNAVYYEYAYYIYI